MEIVIEGNVPTELPAAFIGVPIVLDVQPPVGFRDVPDVEIVPLADGEVRVAPPFRLDPFGATITVPVVDSAGNPRAGVAVVVKVRAA